MTRVAKTVENSTLGREFRSSLYRRGILSECFTPDRETIQGHGKDHTTVSLPDCLPCKGERSSPIRFVINIELVYPDCLVWVAAGKMSRT